MRVLVTGASGFVGRHLVPVLLADHEVVAAVRAPGRAPEGCAEMVVGDIDGSTDWSDALVGVEAVVHLAARVHVMEESAADPLAAYRAVNRDGTLALTQAAAAAGVRRFVFMSSIKVNGESTAGEPLARDSVPAPRDPYGVSKLEAEVALRRIVRDTVMDVVVLRPPVIYGSGVGGNIRRIANAVRWGVPLPLASVHNRRTMLSIENLVVAIRASIGMARAPDAAVLLGDEDPVSTPQLVRWLAEGMGVKARMLPVPIALLRIGGGLARRKGEIDRLTQDLVIVPDWAALHVRSVDLQSSRESLIRLGRSWGVGDRR